MTPPSPPDFDADLWALVVLPLMAAGRGAVTSRALRERGIGTGLIRRWVASGHLVRLRRNLLVDGARWRGLKPWERHRMRAVAASLLLGPGESLSHHSALAVLGIGLFGVDDLVHLCGPGRGRRTNGVVRHRAVPPEQLMEQHGTPVVAPALACLQVAHAFGLEAGVVAADSALRQGRCVEEELVEAAGLPWFLRRRPTVAMVAELATPVHESGGESRTALMLRRLGYTDVRAQVPIAEPGRSPFCRVDFLLEGSVVVEFDGAVKYESGGDVFAEKQREDRLRSLGYEVVRLVWADLAQPEVVRERIDAALTRARAHRAYVGP